MASCAPVSERIEDLVAERELSAYLKGQEEGEKRLGDLLMQQRAEVFELQQGVLDSLQRAVPEVRMEAEKAVVQLALDIAHKLVASLPITPDMVQAEIQRALEGMDKVTEYTVQLHPEDLEILNRCEPTPPGDGAKPSRVRMESSMGVSRGGCVIQTRFGVIDARRETKLESLREALLA